MKNSLENFINEVQADGKLYFTLNDVKHKFDANYQSALKHSLNRLVKKNLIVSLYKGFYVIIPPEYSKQRMIPPELFIDALFKYLGRKYYVGLLSAAFFQGASHQQPQEYFVLVEKPAMRATNLQSLKINYAVKSNLLNCKTEEKKTGAGFMRISTPEQTALDLIKFQNRIGGLNRAASVIYELAEVMKAVELQKVLTNDKENSVLQRLGYVLENIVHRIDLSNVISEFLIGKKIFRVPLKAGSNKQGFNINSKWKIIENHKIEVDF